MDVWIGSMHDGLTRMLSQRNLHSAFTAVSLFVPPGLFEMTASRPPIISLRQQCQAVCFRRPVAVSRQRTGGTLCAMTSGRDFHFHSHSLVLAECLRTLLTPIYKRRSFSPSPQHTTPHTHTLSQPLLLLLLLNHFQTQTTSLQHQQDEAFNHHPRRPGLLRHGR